MALPLKVLILDKSPSEQLYWNITLNEVYKEIDIAAIYNEQEAIEFFNSQFEKEAANLVLIDAEFSLAQMISRIKNHAAFKSSVIIVLKNDVAGSGRNVNYNSAIEAGAHDFYTKPFSFEKMIELIFEIRKKWLNSAGPAN